MVDRDLQNAGQEEDKSSVALEESNEENTTSKTEGNASQREEVTPAVQEEEVTPIESHAEQEEAENATEANSVEPDSVEIPDVTVETEPENQEKETAVAEVLEPTPQVSDSAKEGTDVPTPPEVTSETPEVPEQADLSPEKTEIQESLAEATPTQDNQTEAVASVKAETPETVSTAPSDATRSDDSAAEVESGDEKDDEEEEKEEAVDYSLLSKEQLSESLQALVDLDNVHKSKGRVDDIFHAFEGILNDEKEEARNKFIAEGGEADAFQYSLSELDNRIEASYTLLKDRISQHYRSVNQQKEVNYQKKLDLLEQMRSVVDGEENEASFRQFKELQDEWKATGPVPNQNNRTLWANYHALLDLFYDHRSIYFELKELDRKKNLEAKSELVKKAEALNDYENLKQAIQELNELHQEFKHIGPVPRDHQEDLWLKFKAASDAVYEKRKEFFAEQKSQFGENLKKKQQLVEKLQGLVDFNSDDVRAWNKRTKEVVAVQKEWEAIGGLPRAQAKEINKEFWSSFKKYFGAKNKFFKTLEHEREDNLKLKEGLIAQVEVMKDSTDWRKTGEEIKKLQQEWKKIGPVPHKVRNEIYNRFKTACDKFFKARREASGDIDKEYEQNLAKKKEIIEQIKKLKPEQTDELYDLQNDFNDIGFVPKSAINSIRHEYSEAVNGFIKKSGVDGEEKAKMKMESEMQDLLTGPNADRRVRQKEQGLRRQISKVEEEIALYKNNMEFFTGSSKAQTFKDQFTSKIEKAETELTGLKEQLKILRQMS